MAIYFVIAYEFNLNVIQRLLLMLNIISAFNVMLFLECNFFSVMKARTRGVHSDCCSFLQRPGQENSRP